MSTNADVFQKGLDASWEIDVFGGQRRKIEAAADDFSAAIEDRRSAMISLIAEVARDYLELRGLQERLTIAQDNLRPSTGHARFDALAAAGGV